MSSYQNENSKLLWMIISGISVVVVLIFATQWFLSEKNQETSIAPTKSAIEKTVIATTESAKVASGKTMPIQLVEESIVKDPLPVNDTLAKEEISKLDDLHQQLKDQQQDLKQQHTDVDTLLKLKEDQVKLLEAQLAAQNKS
ncbi:hypothetical protein [Acinetobacter tjernbergiae]|uniref:Uncharacterized protein n=1 Tax=Acinetobacter tjernbergiae DSM 14971 = CIP 107465 TaxID=1120928 RepID=V2UFF8_9GAMM|nr:hypothetical protein [Acinetobacter tjernbergiae]ESK53483.1 hypothetical protein F990_03343 [Acinetobacter tjernbergiae DSM 14971 = CIP 107465]